MSFGIHHAKKIVERDEPKLGQLEIAAERLLAQADEVCRNLSFALQRVPHKQELVWRNKSGDRQRFSPLAEDCLTDLDDVRRQAILGIERQRVALNYQRALVAAPLAGAKRMIDEMRQWQRFVKQTRGGTIQ